MSDQLEPYFGQGRVILEVPQLHVKTFKSALEQSGQLDRTTRITLAMSKQAIAATTRVPEPQDEDTIGEPVSDPLKDKTVTSTPTALTEDPKPCVQFPVLKFDVVSGQYVDPAVQSIGAVEEQRMHIPTTISYSSDGIAVDDTSRNRYNHELKSRILEGLGLSHLSQEISLSAQPVSTSLTAPSLNKSPLQRALRGALEALSQSTLTTRELTVDELVSSFPDSYSVYKPMLLLPHNAFASKAWTALLSIHAVDSESLRPVWQQIAEAVGTTHVAINSPIPLQTSAEPATGHQSMEPSVQENILRSPVNLTPVYGDFGPSPTSQSLSTPTEADFKSALWVTTTQNGIHQTWAPRYTMFSRGNIREKTRLLNLPSVTMDFNVPSAIVDLYAGIGYFAFSYKKGGARKANGIKKILCWEINPWSVEGLRRGVELNGWTCKSWSKKQIQDSEADWEAWRRELEKQGEGKGNDEDFWIFETSNNHAASFVQHMTTPDPPLIPPIRHINLGLLPSSALSWRTAVQTLDFRCGGWIHAHENVRETDIESRAREIEAEFQELWNEWEEERRGEELGKSRGRKVKVEHVERVKMYAPGVVHCVFDVYVQEAS
ncbi:Nn.00g114480.m01.CDS01 [Neocucurbitaria sp. VM-36]